MYNEATPMVAAVLLRPVERRRPHLRYTLKRRVVLQEPSASNVKAQPDFITFLLHHIAYIDNQRVT